MLKQERQNLILKEVMAHHKVYSAGLSELLGVSEDTIRRDLNEMAEHGKLKKVHGGAMANPHIPDLAINQDISRQEERSLIAQKAAKLIENNQVLILEGDTTNLLLIDYIPKNISLTIYTNSLHLALKLHRFNHIETIVLGGRLSQKRKMTVGMDVMRSLEEIHADLCLIESSTLHEDIGITDRDRENAYTKKSMFGSAARVIALSVSEDLGTIQPFKVEDISKLYAIITELNSDVPELERFQKKGVQIY